MATKKTSSGRWMETIKHNGAFSAKAKKAKMTTAAYATKVMKKGSKATALTKKQATVAKIFAAHRKKKAKK